MTKCFARALQGVMPPILVTLSFQDGADDRKSVTENCRFHKVANAVNIEALHM